MNNFLYQRFNLKNKIALVTGGSKGIGKSISEAFFKSDAKVISVGRSLNNNSSKIDYRNCDVSNKDELERLFKYINEIYGGLDILVNVAGVSYSAKDIPEEMERFRKTIDINLTAAFHCSILAANSMKSGGSIVNITSIGSFQGFPDNPGYVASKGGLRLLTKSLANDLGHKNIRVNNIAPGYVKTSMTKKSYSNTEMNNERLNRMLIKRWGNTEDLIGAAIFLASDASSYMTGTSIVVDGGLTSKGL